MIDVSISDVIITLEIEFGNIQRIINRPFIGIVRGYYRSLCIRPIHELISRVRRRPNRDLRTEQIRAVARNSPACLRNCLSLNNTFLIIAIIGASEAPSLIDKIKIFRSSQSKSPDTAYTPPSGPLTRPVFGISRVALFSKESL